MAIFDCMRKSGFHIILVLVVLVFSCSPIKKANKKFKKGEYNEAISLYSRLLKKSDYAAESNFKIGESYRLSNRILMAEPFYNAAVKLGYDNEAADLYYAFALKSRGEYKLAEQQIQKYLDIAQDDKLYTLATKEIENLQYLDELRVKGSYYEIENLELVNTNAPEYSPFFKDDRLYFTSSRGDAKIYKATGTGFTDIYVAQVRNSKVDGKNVKGVGEFINNYNMNEGTLAIAPNGRTMIFARGNSGKKKGTKDVNLYITKYRNKKWSDPKMMNINDPDAWDAGPTFNRNGRTLYFASNREGGFGGTDIYIAHLNANGRWGNVKNLGSSINTPGNEMFPFVADDGRLYFASNGHPGMGGLDIFVASKRRGRIQIENLGNPVNTSADDFGLFLMKANEGFFTSNRSGGRGDDDIYQFVNHDPTIKIVNYYLAGTTITTNENGQDEILPNVRVRLFDTEENILALASTDKNGKFKFRIDVEEIYILMGEKPTYFTTRELYSTEGKTVSLARLPDFETDIVFDTLLRLDRIVIDKSIVLENIYYDLDKAFIRPDAGLELNKLVAVLVDNPEIRIELSSHTDSRQTDDYNQDLSQRRAQAAVDYIISEGIDTDRLIARGYGETQLLNKCLDNVPCSEQEHQVNRRTEFKVIEFDNQYNIKKTRDEELEDRLFDDF